MIDGDVETGSLMAGQSVGLVARHPAGAEILGELVRGAETALARERAGPVAAAAAA